MSSSENEHTQIFVYGTLMRGQRRHQALKDQQFVANALTEPRYQLFLVDDYPGLVDAKLGDGVAVSGEIWAIDCQTLRRLDEIECVDSGLYERRPIQLIGLTKSPEAWFYLPSIEGLREIGGDWRLIS